MKYLIVGDVHLKGKNPASRVDDYYKSIMKKLIYIYKISNDYDGVIFTGDIFDTPNVSYSVIYNFSELLKLFKVPVYTCIGNHDVQSGKIDKLKYSALGLLKNRLNIIGSQAVEIGKGIWLEGVDDVYKIDEDISCYNFKSDVEGVKIKLVHATMLWEGEKFFGNYTTIDRLINVNADVVISGHIHGDIKSKWLKGKLFIRAGSISRVSISDIRDDIYVGVLEINNNNIKFDKIKVEGVLPYNKVFKIKEVSDDVSGVEFINKLEEAGGVDIMDMDLVMKKYLDDDLYKIFKEIWDNV